MHIHTYTYIYIHIHTYTYMYACVRACMHALYVHTTRTFLILAALHIATGCLAMVVGDLAHLSRHETLMTYTVIFDGFYNTWTGIVGILSAGYLNSVNWNITYIMHNIIAIVLAFIMIAWSVIGIT